MKRIKELEQTINILNRIEEEFNEVQKSEEIHGTKKWTRAFLTKLLEIGNCQKGIKVYSSSVDKDDGKKPAGGEWLFDLCWSIEPSSDENSWTENYIGLKLICESEWETSKEEILSDLMKLAVAKAEIKIMIVQYSGDDDFVRIKKLCEASVHESLRNDGSLYILVGSGNAKENMKVKFVQLWENS